ncbi:MAG: helix-turn-helix domain-containing protein [Proteobacteria bacterium]|nr:helix-turn-helix domain-containing protein [Pseudomonadota bacterium]
MTNADRLLTPNQVATRLHVKTRTLANWRVSGKGPPYRKIGGLVRYSEGEVDAWVLSRRRRSTSEHHCIG